MDESLKNNRIFMGGHRKSGTTLPLSLLDGHPDLFIYPYETHFWYSFFPVYAEGEYSLDEKIKRVTDFIFGDLRHIIKKWMNLEESDLKFSFDELASKFEMHVKESNQSTRDFFDIMTLLVRELLPDPNYSTQKIMVSKDTNSEVHADVLFDLYPDAKFIQIVRDPRDNCSVIMNGWDKHYRNTYDSEERLFRDMIDRGWFCNQMGLDNLKKYGSDKYKIVKYEDIVQRPEVTLTEMAEFIGIDPSGLKPYPSFCEIPWGGNSFTDRTYKGINSDRVGIFDKYLTEDQIKVIEYYFMDFMEEMGYNPRFKRTDCLESMSRHYGWFNNNQIYSGSAFRKYEGN